MGVAFWHYLIYLGHILLTFSHVNSSIIISQVNMSMGVTLMEEQCGLRGEEMLIIFQWRTCVYDSKSH